MFQFEHYSQLNTPTYHYIKCYLSTFSKVVQQQLACNNRITCLRFDLRFPKVYDSPDPRVISRFIDALKARLNVWKSQRVIQGKLHHRLGFSYVWVRERNESHNWHYHLVLFFNRDAFAHLGAFDLNRDNMYSRIVSSWASAINMDDIDMKSSVEFPHNSVRYLDSNSVEFYGQLNSFWQQFTYLAKVATKDIDDGNRNIGYSRKVFN